MQLHLGDNIEVLKQYPDNYFDSVVTDPPYGISFMNRKWDYQLPSVETWQEIYRILKHGGHILVACGTRTQHRMVCNIEDAGFEIRDIISWLYGSGFPKSHNISKAIDSKYGAEREVIGTNTNGSGASQIKLDNHSQGDTGIGIMDGSGKVFDITAPATDEAKQWDGWGTALKPACEFFTLARKPLANGCTVADNVLKHGTGGINIDACRISVGSNDPQLRTITRNQKEEANGWGMNQNDAQQNVDVVSSKGRFPANVIFSHHPDCELLGTKKVKGMVDKPTNRTKKGDTWNDENSGLRNSLPKNSGGFGDENGMEEIEEYKCHEDCPIRILNEQSGIRKSGAMKKAYEYKNTGFSLGQPTGLTKQIHGASEGYASRFFYTAKASRSERNYGLPEGERNIHPTVKPIKLMEYLIKLITPIGGLVIDPFMGSGSTGIAAVQNGFNFYGIEMEEHSFKTAEARINFASKEYADNIEKGKIKVTQAGLF